MENSETKTSKEIVKSNNKIKINKNLQQKVKEINHVVSTHDVKGKLAVVSHPLVKTTKQEETLNFDLVSNSKKGFTEVS